MSETDEFPQHRFDYAGKDFSFVLPSTDDHISKTLLTTNGFYEQAMLEAIAPALEPGDVVVDAGANIGNHTVFFAKVLGCRVLAIEAIKSTAILLERNVRMNDISDLVQIKQVAVGATTGRAQLVSYDPNNVGGSTLAVNNRGDIPVCRIDDLVEHRPVRFLKIDVEGMELAVLKGSSRVLKEDRPWVTCEAATEAAYRAVHDYMNEAGYSPVAVYNATDTFLFLPSASDGERRILVDHAFDQVMALQRESRRTNALVAQSGRYSERIKQETIAEVKKRLGDEEAQREALADALAQARLEATVFDQLILDHERQLAAAAQELEDARAFAAAVLAQEQRQLEDAAASAKAARDQNTQLREQLSTARHESIRRRDELAELHRRIVDEREASRIELHELTQLQRRTLGEREAALAELKVLRVNVQASLKAAQQRHNDVSAKLVNAEGMVARKTRELERTQRDLLNRRRQVTATDLKIATIVNTSQATADELALVRNSLSFKLGSLTIESLKSPRRAFALLWTVPKLLLGERRRRAANGGGQR